MTHERPDPTTSPFDILGLDELHVGPDAARIFEAYDEQVSALLANRQGLQEDDWLRVTDLLQARNTALYVADWRAELAGLKPQMRTGGYEPSELADLLAQRKGLDIHRLRRTRLRSLVQAVSHGLWHRTAWDEIAEAYGPEAGFVLLQARAAALALADDPEELLYELESEGVHHLCATSPLARWFAVAALSYTFWSDQQRSLAALMRLLSHDSEPFFFPNVQNLIAMGAEEPSLLTPPGDLDQRTEAALRTFLECVRKAPLLDADLLRDLARPVTSNLAGAPATFLGFLLGAPVPPLGSPMSELKLSRAKPRRTTRLCRYVAQALQLPLAPLLPVWPEDIPPHYLMARGDRFRDLARRQSRLPLTTRLSLAGATLGLALLGNQAIVSAHLPPKVSALATAVLTVLGGSGTVALALGSTPRTKIANPVALAFVSFNTGLPISILVEYLEKTKPWLVRRPAWLRVFDKKRWEPFVSAWDTLLYLLLRFPPQGLSADEVPKTQNGSPFPQDSPLGGAAPQRERQDLES